MCDFKTVHYTRCDHIVHELATACPQSDSEDPVLHTVTITKFVTEFEFCSKKCMWDDYLWRSKRRQRQVGARRKAGAEERAKRIFGELD
jgi:hypothetical protein